jgi:hypothetical protein
MVVLVDDEPGPEAFICKLTEMARHYLELEPSVFSADYVSISPR